MQTKKRAKPVKFGKHVTEKKEEKETPKPKVEASSAPTVAKPTPPAEIKKVVAPPSMPESVEAHDEEQTKNKADDITKVLAGFFKSLEESEDEEKQEKPIDKKEEVNQKEKSVPEEESQDETEEEQEPEKISVASTQEENPSEEKDEEPEEDLEESPFSKPEGESEPKKSIWVYFSIVALVSFIIGIAAMAAYYHFKPNNNANTALSMPGSEPSPTPAPSASSVPTATPTAVPTPATTDVSAYTVDILNGSGITGEAAKLKAKLTAAGFKIGTVGNAQSSDFTKTQVAAKKTVNKAFITKLEDVVKQSYVLDTDATLSSGTDDVVVTIGSTPAK